MGSDRKIVLAKDIGSVRLDLGPAVCVRHKKYTWPDVAGDCEFVEWTDFEATPRRWLDPERSLIIVGLNRIINPGNRTREVFEILYNLCKDVQKWSIDHTLFVGAPWRAWFHWGLVGAKYREYTYSYLAESHWKAYGEGACEEDPFSLDVIGKWGHGVVESRYERFFEDVRVETVRMPPAVHAEYAQLKETCFDEEHTIGRIIARLSRFARESCPERRIPTPTTLFARATHDIVRTDLPVDEYLVNNLLSLVRLTDEIGSAFYGG